MEPRLVGQASEMKHLAAWLRSLGVSLAVMESTAQYWRPVWLTLEKEFARYLAQAQSIAAPAVESRIFQPGAGPPPKATHWTKRLNASLFFVAA